MCPHPLRLHQCIPHLDPRAIARTGAGFPWLMRMANPFAARNNARSLCCLMLKDLSPPLTPERTAREGTGGAMGIKMVTASLVDHTASTSFCLWHPIARPHHCYSLLIQRGTVGRNAGIASMTNMAIHLAVEKNAWSSSRYGKPASESGIFAISSFHSIYISNKLDSFVKF